MLGGAISARQLTGLLPGGWQARPAYRSLADSMRRLVLDGRLPPGTRMPSERALSQELPVSRTTVSEAYARLRDAEFLVSRRGAASVITLPREARSVATPGLTPAEPTPGAGLPAGPSGPSGPASRMPATARPGFGYADLDLAVAAMEATPGIGAAVEAAAFALPAYLGGHGYTPLGLPVLRELLAARYTARGLPTTSDQIVVTAGALQAFGLVLQACIRPGDRVLVEQPTYPNALETIRAMSGQPVPMPFGAAGWDLGRCEAMLRQTSPSLTYLIVDFQNPTGLVMPGAERTELAGLLRRLRTLAVADETLVDLGLDVAEPELPAPLPSYGRADDDLVAIGSAGKAYWGGLGVGWLRAPSHLMPALAAARTAGDLGPALLAQLTVAELIEGREQILAERRSVLRARRDALAAAVADLLPDWRFRLPSGGLALWCELPRPVATALAVRAEQHGVRLGPGTKFGTDGTLERFVRLPYTLPEVNLLEAVRRAAGAYAEVAAAAPSGRREHLTVV